MVSRWSPTISSDIVPNQPVHRVARVTRSRLSLAKQGVTISMFCLALFDEGVGIAPPCRGGKEVEGDPFVNFAINPLYKSPVHVFWVSTYALFVAVWSLSQTRGRAKTGPWLTVAADRCSTMVLGDFVAGDRCSPADADDKFCRADFKLLYVGYWTLKPEPGGECGVS